MKNKGNNHCDGCGGSVRTLAASAGIQFGDLQTEAYRLREKLGPDHQKAYYEIIRQLARGGAVSETEQRVLLELGKRGFGVGSDREAEKFVAYVQSLHKRMLADRSASPVAGDCRCDCELCYSFQLWSARPRLAESVPASGPRHPDRCRRWRAWRSADERLESHWRRSRWGRRWCDRRGGSALLANHRLTQTSQIFRRL